MPSSQVTLPEATSSQIRPSPPPLVDRQKTVPVADSVPIAGQPTAFQPHHAPVHHSAGPTPTYMHPAQWQQSAPLTVVVGAGPSMPAPYPIVVDGAPYGQHGFVSAQPSRHLQAVWTDDHSTTVATLPCNPDVQAQYFSTYGRMQVAEAAVAAATASSSSGKRVQNSSGPTDAATPSSPDDVRRALGALQSYMLAFGSPDAIDLVSTLYRLVD
ncbi:hypothetical protein ON010_g8717 [Phytophthora cinnamomi]|nr:hypothetical protein ON010_g8717 [Phytophthora cinnamomi]